MPSARLYLSSKSELASFSPEMLVEISTFLLSQGEYQ
jgi:hypothetical protein